MPRFLSFLLTSTFLFSYSVVFSQKNDWPPLGTIVTSTLPYEKFSEATDNNKKGGANDFDPYDSEWAPADGRDIVGSCYNAIYGLKNAPDLRGQFLRGNHKFYGPNEEAWDYWNCPTCTNYTDTIIKKAQYIYQEQSTKKPEKFKINSKGLHSHDGLLGVNEEHLLFGKSEADNFVRGASYGKVSTNPGPEKIYPTLTSEKGGHDHETDGWDQETRPNNMHVFYYIRVNYKKIKCEKVK